MGKNKAVVEITLGDIYNKLMDFKEENDEQHKELLIHAVTTNGKVKTNRILIGSITSALGMLAIWFFTHLNSLSV